MAIVSVCGFECGNGLGAGSAFSPHWTFTGNTTGHATPAPQAGLQKLIVRDQAGARPSAAYIIPSAAVCVLRAYLNINSAPTVDTVALGFVSVGSTAHCGLGFNTADSKWYPAYDDGTAVTFGAAGITIATGSWTLVDIRVDFTANPWTIDVTVAGSSLTQLTRGVAATTSTSCILGQHSASTNVWGVNDRLDFDSVLIGNASGDYPIGAGTVTPHSPNRDGTHTGTGNNFQRGNAGTSIVAGVTDAYLLVDELPFTSSPGTSDFISQVTSSPTEYCEIGFASTTTLTAPQAVALVLGFHQGSTARANMKWEWNDGGTTALIVSETASGSSGLRLLSYHYASRPSGGAWTSSVFNSLLLRFGYSTDANPDVYFDAAVIEAGFSSTGGGAIEIVGAASGLGALSVSAPGFTMWTPIMAPI